MLRGAAPWVIRPGAQVPPAQQVYEGLKQCILIAQQGKAPPGTSGKAGAPQGCPHYGA